MNTRQIAARLVELCRQGENEQAYKELFADHAVAIEPAGTPAPRTEGLKAILEKSRQFQNMVEEVHSMSISDPLVAGNFFTCTMGVDATMQDGSRDPMEEICLYKVENGKVVSEQFFY